MSNFPRSKIIFGNTRLFLLVTIVYLSSPRIEAMAIDGNNGANSFVKSEEEMAGNILKDSTDDSEAFYDLLRSERDWNEFSNDRLANDEYPDNLQHFLPLRDDHPVNLDDNVRATTIRLDTFNDRSMNLPERFSYVAREFYLSWKASNSPTKDVRGTVDGPDNGEKRGKEISSEDNKEEYSNDGSGETKIPNGIGGRNIIGAPVNGCPPGERRDRNGRCRRQLW